VPTHPALSVSTPHSALGSVSGSHMTNASSLDYSTTVHTSYQDSLVVAPDCIVTQSYIVHTCTSVRFTHSA